MKHSPLSNWLARVGTEVPLHRGLPALATVALLVLGQSGAFAGVAYPPTDPLGDYDLDGTANYMDADDDADGVMDLEDTYPFDASKYINSWANFQVINKANGLPVSVAGNGPIANMWDGSTIWSVEPSASQYMQVTWGNGTSGFENYIFTTHAPVKKDGGLDGMDGNICTDSGWGIVWYVGTDDQLYATYYSASWQNVMVSTGAYKISRIHHVDSFIHAVWARTTNGEDIVIWYDSGWKSAIVQHGGTIAWSGMASNERGSLGWDPNGNLFQRAASTGWAAELIVGGGSLGPVGGTGPFGRQNTRYAVDVGRDIYWYGTGDGKLGWTYVGSFPAKAGTLPSSEPYPASGTKVAPHSPTYASSGFWFVYVLDGYLDKDKIRVFWNDNGAWMDTVVGEYRGFAGDQADVTSNGKLFYINVNPSTGTPTLEYLHYAK